MASEIEDLIARLNVRGRLPGEMANHHVRRMETERIDAAAEIATLTRNLAIMHEVADEREKIIAERTADRDRWAAEAVRLKAERDEAVKVAATAGAPLEAIIMSGTIRDLAPSICTSCGTTLGEGWCRACDAEHDRRNPPEAAEMTVACPSCGGDGGWNRSPPLGGWQACRYCDGKGRLGVEAVVEEMTAELRTGGAYCLRAGLAVIRALLDRINSPESPEPRMAAIRAEIAETAGAVETTDERTPMPDADLTCVLRYLYVEAGVRANMLGATDEERLAHAAVRQDIRELAERFGVDLDA